MSTPLASLKDPSLLKTQGLINGQWVSGASHFAVHDPATGAHLVDVANLGPQEAEAAIAAAHAARRQCANVWRCCRPVFALRRLGASPSPSPLSVF